MRDSARSFNKEGRNLEVSPSKVKFSVNEIPEEGDSSNKKTKRNKKDEKKLN